MLNITEVRQQDNQEEDISSLTEAMSQINLLYDEPPIHLREKLAQQWYNEQIISANQRPISLFYYRVELANSDIPNLFNLKHIL
jgi:hypothetical protein